MATPITPLNPPITEPSTVASCVRRVIHTYGSLASNCKHQEPHSMDIEQTTWRKHYLLSLYSLYGWKFRKRSAGWNRNANETQPIDHVVTAEALNPILDFGDIAIG